MAVQVLTDAVIDVDATVIAGSTVALAYSAEAVQVSQFGDRTRKHVGGGMLEWSLAVEAPADETILGAFFDKVGTVVPVKVRASSDVISEGNPSYEGDAVLSELTPIDGAVGDAQMVSMSFVAAGDLARITTVTP